MDDLFGVPMSVGTISQSEKATTAVVAEPVEEARAYVQEQAVAHLDETSCQLLAQNTHPHTPMKQGGKAGLKRDGERMEGAEAHTDHPAAPPPDDPGDRPDVPQQAHQPIPPQPLSG